ncbi:hypothetical protein HMPREF0063_11896 [Aeromicrobium marinum DSM 15272]|uniref:Uncharacterized protein n=1 Tax=Aeromicrobium marinum DSM 15272 TaxID=585531 RepID=E2SDW0_9ACTN|nr:hypothetical protein [Aeromicrobium marinum]EFQ82687.1 hypothetical protein HMPREF0063_11896 [Aeromicrobium marinum DSM 15272]
MGTFTPAARETASLEVTGLGLHISLHTADPGTTGASEATGGSPAYARQPTTWTGGASDGSVAGSEVTFDAAAGTYSHFGIWSASTAGTFIGGGALSSPATLGAQGQVKVTPTVTVNN